jgi:hypothetical protein
MEEKRLPGQTLSELNPGGNIASQAARGAGVLTDMDGKLRCPPGTPAANQFTDVNGSNCFGISSGQIMQGVKKFAGMIARGIGELDIFNNDGSSASTAEGEGGLSSGKVRNAARFWEKFGINLGEAGRVPWESRSGKRKLPVEMTPAEFAAENSDEYRLFLNGAERGRKNLRTRRERTKKALEVIGVEAPSGWDPNSDLEEAFKTKLSLAVKDVKESVCCGVKLYTNLTFELVYWGRRIPSGIRPVAPMVLSRYPTFPPAAM